VAFDLRPGGGAIIPRLTHIRRLLVVTTHGSPWWFMTLVMREPGRAVLTRGLRRLLAADARLSYLTHYGMDTSTPASRARFLARVERAADAL
jgi:putative NADPH-quinone reductase